MSNLMNDQLTELINETLGWSSEIQEMWVGTTIEKIITAQKDSLLLAVEENDMELAQKLVHELAQTLESAEEQYED
jgi:hypothetical protein